VKQISKKWPASGVGVRQVSELKPHPRNSRRHTKEQIELISKSISEWGFTIPVLIDEHNTILAGHARVEAAKALKLESVPVVVANGWSEASSPTISSRSPAA
jgi:ParB-like chromosome segregation protein Spo0J